MASIPTTQPPSNSALALRYLKENQSSAVSILEKTLKFVAHIFKGYGVSHERFIRHASTLDGFSSKLCASGASIITCIPSATGDVVESIAKLRSASHLSSKEKLDAVAKVASAGKTYLVAGSIFGGQNFYSAANSFSLISNMSKLVNTAREFPAVEGGREKRKKAFLELVRYTTAVAINVFKVMRDYLEMRLISNVALLVLELVSECIGAASTIYGYKLEDPKVKTA